MAYTSHGHHINGTVLEPEPNERARCGGPGPCSSCSREAMIGRAAEVFPQVMNNLMGNEAIKMQQVHGPATIPSMVNLSGEKRTHIWVNEARNILKRYIEEQIRESAPFPNVMIPAFDIHVVWWSKTLQHWKGVFTTTRDASYYELTHDGIKNVTYVDTYSKVSNAVVPD